MEETKFKQQFDKLKSNQRLLISQIEIDAIEKCPYIIEVGALTVSTNEKGKVLTENSIHPMQFTQKAVDEIMTLTFRNGKDEIVNPIVYGRNEWYKNRLNMVEESIELLLSKEMIAK